VLAKAKRLKDREFDRYLGSLTFKRMDKEGLLFIAGALKLYGYDLKAKKVYSILFYVISMKIYNKSHQ